MLVSHDGGYDDRVRTMTLHGMSRDAWKRYTATGSWRYDVVAPGFKYNLTDIAAALGLAQLAKVEALWRRRHAIAQRYSAALGLYPELEIPVAQPYTEHAWHLYILRLNLTHLTITRDEFIEELRKRGIGSSVHFIPLHTFSYYRSMFDLRDEAFPVTCREFERLVSLPIYPTMSDADVNDVLDAIDDIVTKHRIQPRRERTAAAS